MTFKHIGFSDSEVMRELEKQELKKDDPTKIVKCASQTVEYSPSNDLFQDIVSLARGLRTNGYVKEAESLETKLFIYKTAETHLYKVFEEEGEDLINFSHQDGDVEVAPSKEGYGKVETLTSQQKKIHDVVNKKPTGKLAGGNPDGVKKSGLGKTADVWESSLKRDVNLPAQDIKQEWGQLQNYRDSIIALINDKKEWTIAYGSSVGIGNTKIFFIESDAPDLLEFNDQKITLFTETGGGLVGGKASVGTPVAGNRKLLEFYLEKTGGLITFEQKYPRIFEKIAVNAQPGQFESLFAQNKIDIINNAINIHISKIPHKLAIDFGTAPNLNNPNEVKTSLHKLNTARDAFHAVMVEGVDQYVQSMLINKLDDDMHVRMVKLYNELQESISKVQGILQGVLTKPQVTIGPAQLEGVAQTVPIWKALSTKLLLTKQVNGQPVNRHLAMRFDIAAKAASKNSKAKAWAPVYIAAANFCRQFPTNTTLWHLLRALGTKEDNKFAGWESRFKTLGDLDKALIALENMLKSSGAKLSMVKIAQDPLNPFGSPPPSKPTKPVRKAPSVTKSQTARFDTFRERYIKSYPEAFDAVTKMQKYLIGLGNFFMGKSEWLKNHGLSEDIAVVLSGTGASAGAQKDINQADGIWGANTNNALKQVATIFKTLNVDGNVDYKTTYKSGAKAEASANANIEVIKKGFREAGLTIGIKPKNKPNVPKVDNWDQITKTIFNAVDLYKTNVTGDIPVPVGTFKTFRSLLDFLTLHDLMPQSEPDNLTVAQWRYAILWFWNRARWLKNNRYMSAVQELGVRFKTVTRTKQPNDVVTVAELEGASKPVLQPSQPKQQDPGVPAHLHEGAQYDLSPEKVINAFPFSRDEVNLLTVQKIMGKSVNSLFPNTMTKKYGSGLLRRGLITRELLFEFFKDLSAPFVPPSLQGQLQDKISTASAFWADLYTIADEWQMKMQKLGAVDPSIFRNLFRYQVFPWKSLIDNQIIPLFTKQYSNRPW